MWLWITIALLIAITFFVMVNSNENFKLSGKFKHNKKNKFQHKILDSNFYQESFIEIIGPKIDESVEVVVTAFLIQDLNNLDSEYAIMVLVNDIKLGYLSDEDALKFKKLLKLSNLSEKSGINVQALIHGDWGIGGESGNFKINLNISKDLSDSEIV